MKVKLSPKVRTWWIMILLLLWSLCATVWFQASELLSFHIKSPLANKKAISFGLVASRTGFISFWCPWTQTGKGHSVFHSIVCPVMWLVFGLLINIKAIIVWWHHTVSSRPLLETTSAFIFFKGSISWGELWAWKKSVNSFLKCRKIY